MRVRVRVRVCVCLHLSVPVRVDGAVDDARALVLAVVGQGGENAVLPRLDGDLQVGVWAEEHPLLQAHRVEVFTRPQKEAQVAKLFQA